MMKSTFALVALLFAIPAEAADLDISKYAKVYRGPEGLEVTFVGLRSKRGALIRVSGVDTEIDGVIMRYEVANSGRDRVRYHTALHGERFGTFHMRTDRGTGAKSAFMFLPEAPTQKIVVTYDEARSKKVNSDKFLSTYQTSKNKKAAAKLGAWNRSDRIKKQNAWFEEEADGARKACDTKFSVSIDWKSITDEHLKEYSIYGYCSHPLSALRRICRDSDEYKAQVKKQVKKFRCRFGKKLELDLKNGTLDLETATETPNQEDFATSYLKNTL